MNLILLLKQQQELTTKNKISVKLKSTMIYNNRVYDKGEILIWDRTMFNYYVSLFGDSLFEIIRGVDYNEINRATVI